MSTQVISFHYTLTDPEGTVLDESAEGTPMAFLVGSSQIIPGLESELVKMQAGESKQIFVTALNAYGERDERLLINIPRDEFPVKTVSVGDQFQAGPEGPPFPLTAIEVTDEKVVLDGNHPLAGVDLNFDVEIAEVRNATDEELAHGHVHGAHGHHH